MGEQRNLTEENVAELRASLEKMSQENPDLEYDFFEQKNEITISKDTLTDIVTTMKHARSFISTREKMHPTGIKLYNELLGSLENVR